MLTDNDRINGLPIRAEIRVPRETQPAGDWLTSVVICQDEDKGSFVVWSVFQTDGYGVTVERGTVHAENGIYDIQDYGRALEKAMRRVKGAL